MSTGAENTLDSLFGALLVHHESNGLARDARRVLDELFSLDDATDEPLPTALREWLEGAASDSYFDWRYKTEGPLAGEGATAQVSVAVDSETGRRVALKRFRSDASSTRALRRFLREAHMVASVQHANIPPVLDFSVDRQRNPYFALPVLDGGTLSARRGFGRGSESLGPLENAPMAVSWVESLVDIANAAHAGHVAGILHRDIKPANIVFDDSGGAFLIDWGAARWLDEVEPIGAGSMELGLDGHSLTLAGATVGTLGYLAPEVAHGERATIATDVYSLGATLYTVLSGRVPHVHEQPEASLVQLMHSIATTAPVPLSKHCPKLPADLIAIAEKAMARQPGERYPSADAFARDMRLYLLGHPTVARRPSPIRRIGMATRRRPGWTTALLGLGAVGLVSAGIGGSAAVTAMDRTASIEQRSVRTEIMRLRRNASAPYSVDPQDIEQLQETLDAASKLGVAVTTLEERRRSLASGGSWPKALRESRAADHQLLKNDVEMERARLAMADSTDDPKAFLEGRAGRLEAFIARLEEFEAENILPDRMDFPHPADAWEYAQLSEDIALAKVLLDPEEGLLYGRSIHHGLGLQPRVDLVTERRDSPQGGALWNESWEAFEAWLATQGAVWDEAKASIQREGDLVFLGVGEEGLPEFSHSLTGDLGMTLGDVPTETSAIVLVLVPGGDFTAGVQGSDPDASNFVSYAAIGKKIPYKTREVSVGPFFISKYEVTQGQWLMLTGTTPSVYGPQDRFDYFKADGSPLNLRHPVESVSHRESHGVLLSVGLTLPTAHQWEYAARAGTTTSWPFGNDVASLEGYANVGDKFCLTHAEVWASVPWSDGALVHNVVGSYAPNAFGLYDMVGNVSEWLIGPSPAFPSPLLPVEPLTGALPGEWVGAQAKAIGGNFSSSPVWFLPVNSTNSFDAESRDFFSGVRPCRNLRPLPQEEAQK